MLVGGWGGKEEEMKIQPFSRQRVTSSGKRRRGREKNLFCEL